MDAGIPQPQPAGNRASVRHLFAMEVVKRVQHDRAEPLDDRELQAILYGTRRNAPAPPALSDPRTSLRVLVRTAATMIDKIG
jgi:hypothetical protein